eukprot:TRINITY_DN1642_c0_g1_i3.p1 TRINITY_DN1642_c0_g1~~TRINITY_DN1642_c0_g1_i3.p1  ORF type:complete len:594 (+),score=227.91 TRINITY_DN1642_c0_g1_i3:267-2048(+)
MSSMYGLKPDMNHLHGVHDPHMNGLSLQEMIDTDIKAEFDDVMTSNQLSFNSLDSLELLGNLDNLETTPFKFDSRFHEVDEVLNHPNHWNTTNNAAAANNVNSNSQQQQQQPQQQHQDMAALHSTYFDDSLSGNIQMVNPNSVMPVVHQVYHSGGSGTLTPSPIPPTSTAAAPSMPTVVPQQQHNNNATALTINTGGYNPAAHLNLHSPAPSPISPQTYPQHHMQQQHHHHQQQHPQHYQFAAAHHAATHHHQQKTLKILPPVSSPLQQVPSPSHHVVGGGVGGVLGAAGPLTPNSMMRKKVVTVGGGGGMHPAKDSGFPKPAYSYSCLIALALKNSRTGSMSVSEIYKFMCEHFPYFKTAPNGWKNSVRHNLSLNKCFEKIEKPATNGTNQRKGCLWAMNKEKVAKMDDEVKKWSRKDPMAIKKAMYCPNTLEALERGEMVKDYNSNSALLSGPGGIGGGGGVDSEDEEDPRTPASVSSQGSQGYASAESDFIDMEGFPNVPDNSLPELNIQAVGGVYEDMMTITRTNRSPTEINATKIVGSNTVPHTATVVGAGPNPGPNAGPVGKSVFIPHRYTANYSINSINFVHNTPE